MKRVLCSPLPKVGQKILIEATEAKHLTTVLRLTEGEVIELLNGEGQKCQAKIHLQEKKVFAEGITPAESNPKLNALPLHLYLSILKGEAMEWVIEKAVELGVRSLTPLHTDYTVVQIQKKGADTFVERWQKIADQSLKQCGRLECLKINSPTSLEEIFINKTGLTLWLDETMDSSNKGAHLLTALNESSANPISILVGPEGGFSPHERERLLKMTLTPVNKGETNISVIKRVHLGALILRAETAALMATSLVAGKLYGNT